MSNKLQQAITAIKSGDKETGKQLLIEELKANPRNEDAWLWMTNVVSSNEERIKCLANVLKINPDNETAKRGLSALQQPRPTTSPSKIEKTIDSRPPMPLPIPKSEEMGQPKPLKVDPKPASPPPFPPPPPGKASSKKNSIPPTPLPKPVKDMAPRTGPKNRTLIYILAAAIISVIVACIGCFTLSLMITSSPSFKATQTARAIVRTTTTPALTPTPTSTPTPSYLLSLPQELRDSEGLVFSVNRVDFLTSIDDPAQRYTPQNGIFLWLIGTVRNSTNTSHCIHGDKFTLRNGEKKIQMLRETAEAIHNVYDLDYPGFILGQCLSNNEITNSFLIFDVPKDAEDLLLELGDTKIRLGQLSTLMQATPIPFIPPTPMPTNTPLPTDTPKPIDTISPDTQVERWIPIGGRIWTGLKVYYGTGSEKAYGFEVLGGSENCLSMPSGRGVKVLFPSGSEEWKDRDYLISSGLFFALESDPALSAMQWYEYYDCP